MGKTKDRLLKRDLSRGQKTEIGFADIVKLLDQHLGAKRPHVQDCDPSRLHEDASRLMVTARVTWSDDAHLRMGRHAKREVGDGNAGKSLRLNEDISHLIFAIGVAKSEHAIWIERNASSKYSIKTLQIKALRAMYRLAKKGLNDDLIATLQNCDGATLNLIQIEHAELYHKINGMPVFETREPSLRDDDLIAILNSDDPKRYARFSHALVTAPDTVLTEDELIKASQGGDDFLRVMEKLNPATTDSDKTGNYSAFRQTIELPTANQPLHLPLGFDGVKQAIADAITVAIAEKEPKGRKELPYKYELARSCWTFMQKYQPTASIEMLPKEAPPSPAVTFTKDVFDLAGMQLGNSRIEELLTAARKPRPRLKKPEPENV